jgi:hypothetical protein
MFIETLHPKEVFAFDRTEPPWNTEEIIYLLFVTIPRCLTGREPEFFRGMKYEQISLDRIRPLTA